LTATGRAGATHFDLSYWKRRDMELPRFAASSMFVNTAAYLSLLP